jgi:hypothetical protein
MSGVCPPPRSAHQAVMIDKPDAPEMWIFVRQQHAAAAFVLFPWVSFFIRNHLVTSACRSQHDRMALLSQVNEAVDCIELYPAYSSSTPKCITRRVDDGKCSTFLPDFRCIPLFLVLVHAHLIVVCVVADFVLFLSSSLLSPGR